MYYNPFTETKNLFTQYVEYQEPLDFDAWAQIADDQKAAVLYLHFYDQITLAWYKADSLNRGSEEDAVSTVLQYLQKNVPIILATPKKFTPNYIYRVAYNCLYCICHDIKRDKDRFAFEVRSTVPTSDGQELDLCDLVPNRDEDITTTKLKEYFWANINDLGDEAQAVVSKLLKEEVGKRAPRVSAKRREEIVIELRKRLTAFQNVSFS